MSFGPTTHSSPGERLTQAGKPKGAPERLTRAGFAMTPLRLMEDCRTRKGTLFVYLWLWHHAGIADQAFPSLQKLSLECGMKPDDTREAIRWLCEEGWVERIERPGYTTLFHVRTEHLHPSPKRGTPPPKGGSPKGSTPPLPQMGEDTNKRTRTKKLKTQEPPFVFPPAGESAGQAVATHTQPDPYPDQVQTQDPNPLPEHPDPCLHQETHQRPLEAAVSDENPLKASFLDQPQQEALETLLEASEENTPAKGKKARFQPTEADIPAILLPVALEILGFWKAKAGKKTPEAWKLLLTELHKIWDDPAGGTEVLRQQLEAGIEAKIYGDGWQSIKYANWKKYARDRHRSNTQPQLTKYQKAGLSALAKIRAMEAQKAQEQQSNTLAIGGSLL